MTTGREGNAETATGIPPWAQGPAELFRHAESHFRQPEDTDRRLALIGFDNAIEVCIDAFLGLHPRHRNGYEIPREEREAALRNYHAKIEFLERYAAERGSVDDIPFDEVLWYHQLRNELYHSGNGMTPERQHLLGIRAAARSVFQALFEREVLPAAPGEAAATSPESAPTTVSDSGSMRLDFLSAYIDFERALATRTRDSIGAPVSVLWARYADAMEWARDTRNDVNEARRLRNAIAHGQPVEEPVERLAALAERLRHITMRIRESPAVEELSNKKPTRGRALAQRAWRVAKQGDPGSVGMSTPELLDAVVGSGANVAGDRPTRVLYDALNNAPDLFSKQGGKFAWRDAAVQSRGGMSGVALIEVILRDCEWLNSGNGRHYQSVLARLRERGVPVKGPNPGRTVNAALNYGIRQGKLLRAGRGMYRCGESLP